MTEEPYRWMEAIANRREYIEHQLASGSPIAALSYREGVLLFTLGRERQKIFEIYDRIGMGGLGHPGDIERLRMAAIELTSSEGFTRSALDVSLRRLATYSLSPVLKAAFEQVYGPPYLARLLFAELGRGDAPPLFLRLDYDGSMHTNGGSFAKAFEHFGVISGTAASMTRMEIAAAGAAPPGSLAGGGAEPGAGGLERGASGSVGAGNRACAGSNPSTCSGKAERNVDRSIRARPHFSPACDMEGSP